MNLRNVNKNKLYQFTLWTPKPRTNKKLYNKKQTNKIIERLLEKESKPSFDVYRVDANGWKTLVMKHHTNEHFKK